MAKSSAIMKTDESKPKLKRERIVLIETKPKDNWFVRSTTTSGRVVWYLRFEVTGQHPQLFGPFRSKHQCLLFLDDALNAICDYSGEVIDACLKRMLRETCQHISPPIVEYPLLTQLHSTTKKGR